MDEPGHMRLNDEQVRQRVEDTWDEISGWTARLSKLWIPAPDSAAAGDDAASTSELKPSYLTWTSIYSATEHLTTAWVYLLNFGPTVFSIHSLLRTAMLASAQAVWLLAPADRAERVDRASRLSHDCYVNQLKWTNDFKDPNPQVVDATQLVETRRVLKELLGDGPRGILVWTTDIVRDAADHVFRASPAMTAECLAAWRVLCCAAHALPWDLNMRPETEHHQHGEGYVSATPPSWTSLQAALSIAPIFTRAGWRLLDQQGAAEE